MKNINGFTLIEMLIVLAVLAIVAGLGYPSYAGHVVRAKRIEGQLALVEAMQRQERYFALHNTYVAFAADGAGPAAQDAVWWSGERPAASAYELDGHACPGSTLAECVEIRARPGTDRVDGHFRDPACGALTLDSAGRQGAQAGKDGQAGAPMAARCWP